MARMVPPRIPPEIEEDPNRNGEMDVYAQLEATLDDEWRVYSWVRWHKDRRLGIRSEGEMDFVIAHPRLGFLVAEVKGGQIRQEGRLWYSRGPTGAERDTPDPFGQAMEGKNILLRQLKSRLAEGEVWVPCAHAVILPHASATPGNLSITCPARLLCCKEHMKTLGSRLKGILVEESGQMQGPLRFGVEGFEALDALLNPPSGRRRPLSELIRETDEALQKHTPECYALRRRLEQNSRMLVTGGAGTGKTLLAVLLARYFSSRGSRTLLVCFNRPLADFLREPLERHENLEVWNFHQLCYQRGIQAGFDGLVDPDGPEADGQRQEYFSVQLPRVLKHALDALPPGPDGRFDSIVVDEGQDFKATYWEALEHAFANPLNGTLHVFFDPSQNIYGGVEPQGMFRDFLGENRRNTRQIHRVLAHVTHDDVTVATGEEGPSVKWVRCSRGEEPGALAQVVRTLVDDQRVPVQDIVILTERKSGFQRLAPGGRIGDLEVTRDPRERSTRLLLETIWRFKGLESPVVILADLTDRSSRAEDNLHGVAVSRARAYLVVIGDEATIAGLRPDSKPKP
jgi:hypothetical protein